MTRAGGASRSLTFNELAAFAAFAACAALGCNRAKPEPTSDTPPPTESAAPSSSPRVGARGVRLLRAPAGDVAAVVSEARARARADGGKLVVYVGAPWCEPCQYFHEAASNGELDADLPDVTLLEFDLDQDGDRLARAGYFSQYVPLFAMPGEDGRASDKKFSGSIKGPGAVANITPRLRSLLAR